MVAHAFRQPLLLAYIIAGALLGPVGFGLLTHATTLETLSTLGVALLLFLIGLDLDLRRLRSMTRPALIVGAGQIIITALIGVGIVLALGIPLLPAVYIALALTFSSTVVVVKLLSEKGVLDAWYARLTVGILIIQDIIAVLALLLLAGIEQGGLDATSALLTVVWFLFKGTLLAAGIILVTGTLLAPLLAWTARVPELLVLTSIAWCLAAALVATLAGFSLAIGAFFAGVALAQLPFHTEISARVRTLRDFFITLFFVALGAQLTVVPSVTLIATAVLLSLFVLIGNPLIVMALMGALRYKKRISFFVGLAIAQISEFSLLLMAEGLRLGHVADTHVLLITMVGVITFPLSSILIMHAERFYTWLAPWLSLFERKTPLDLRYIPRQKTPVAAVLIGYHRMGSIIAQTLERLRMKSLIIDFNPDIIRALMQAKRMCVYGDASDRELLDAIRCTDTAMIISTVPDYEENAGLLRYCQERSFKGRCMVTALSTTDALALYRAGADYVIFPHALSALHFSALLRTARLEGSNLGLERTRHMKTLEGMMKKELPY